MDARLDCHDLGTKSRPWLLVATVLVLVLIPMLEASHAAGASPNACRVRIASTGQVFRQLQPAVDAATKGDRLVVKGTCVGKTVIGKTLLVEGIATSTSGKPRLSGAGKTRVVEVPAGVRVELRNLEILRGRGGSGGALLNRGNLILRDVLLHRSKVGISGSVLLNEGTLALSGSTRISRNPEAETERWKSLGDVLVNRGTVTLNDTSSIHGNRAMSGSNYGTLTMNDTSHMSDNLGAIQNWGPVGTITMNDASHISGNDKGGVENSHALVMNDSSSIAGNGHGVDNHGTLTMNGSSRIVGNEGGVWNFGTVTMNDASAITDNAGYGIHTAVSVCSSA